MPEKRKLASETEEREIEALYQQNRTRVLSTKDTINIQLRQSYPVRDQFESDADRLERLQHELERRDRQWTEHWSKMHQPEKQVPLRDAGSILLWLVIIALGTCTFWAMVAVFVWGGSLWPR